MKAYRRPLLPPRGFAKNERRMFCPCELCRLRFGRLLYPQDPRFHVLGLGWRKRRPKPDLSDEAFWEASAEEELDAFYRGEP